MDEIRNTKTIKPKTMKEVINSLYYSAINSLESMRKSDMTLCERIKYEKALVQLNAVKRILDKYELQP